MTYPSMDGYQPGPPERSPWSSPVVIVAIAAGVLLVLAGVLAAVLLLPRSESTSSSAASSSAVPTTVVTTTVPPGQGTAATGPTTTVTAPTVTETRQNRPVPSVAGADWQGFVDGPRCNAATDPAVAIGRTSRSRVVVCRVGDQGGLYYKGLADGNAVEVQYPEQQGNVFRATNGPYEYLISPVDLTIFQNGTTVAAEPMLEYWMP